jgi:hypothetical protein
MAAPDLPAFDPAIIERHVENTYRKATAVFLGSVVAGVMIGAVFGAMPLTSLGESWPIPRMFGFATMLIGAIVGGVIGYLVGDTRAFLARLQGQTALAQIEAANDARLALEAIHQIQALATRRAAAAPQPQPAPAQAQPAHPAPPQPEPQAEPAPPQPIATPAPLAPVPPPAPAPAPMEIAPEPAPAPVEPPPPPPALVIAGAATTADAPPPATPPLSS